MKLDLLEHKYLLHLRHRHLLHHPVTVNYLLLNLHLNLYAKKYVNKTQIKFQFYNITKNISIKQTCNSLIIRLRLFPCSTT